MECCFELYCLWCIALVHGAQVGCVVVCVVVWCVGSWQRAAAWDLFCAGAELGNYPPLSPAQAPRPSPPPPPPPPPTTSVRDQQQLAHPLTRLLWHYKYKYTRGCVLLVTDHWSVIPLTHSELVFSERNGDQVWEEYGTDQVSNETWKLRGGGHGVVEDYK